MRAGRDAPPLVHGLLARESKGCMGMGIVCCILPTHIDEQLFRVLFELARSVQCGAPAVDTADGGKAVEGGSLLGWMSLIFSDSGL